MTLHRFALVIPALLLSACDPPKGNLGEYSTTDASDTSTGTTSEPETSTTTGDPIDPLCEDPADPSAEQASISFDPPLPQEVGITAFSETCAVLTSQPNQIGLLCDGTEVNIELTLDEAADPLLAIGDEVALEYRSVMSFGIDQWFTLRYPDNTLLLASVNAQELEPPDVLEFLAPLVASKVEGVCQTPITCDDMKQKLAVQFVHEDEGEIQVYSRHHALLGGLRISVANARRHYQEVQEGDQICSVFDAPEVWFSTLIRRVGE